jgi:tetraacyldisaccharide 4'-kinase
MLPFPPSWRGWVGRSLEQGAWQSPVARGLSRAYARISDPVRPVSLPSHARVIGIGGATLGGGYKTPLVLALAKALKEHGSVAVVASSYAARPARGLVGKDTGETVVGDEASWLASVLTPLGIPVFADGRRRRDTLRLAANLSQWVLMDGVLQTRPRRLHRSLLVLDGSLPWGAGSCPPAGDLRADRYRLLHAADALVVVLKGPDGVVPEDLTQSQRPVFRVTSRLSGAHAAGGARVDLTRLRSSRLGLVVAVGRPGRILEALRLEGIQPTEVVLHADHARPELVGRSRGAKVDAWLTTGKCATKLGARLGRAPVWVIDHSLELDPGLVEYSASASIP